MIRSPGHGAAKRRPALRCLAALLACMSGCLAGCDSQPAAHPAVGRPVGSLPLVALADRSRPPPAFSGRVTLLNFFGTWCMPCRRELPGLARLAGRLRSEPAFQLVAVSCGAGGPEDLDRLAELTVEFLGEQRLAIDAWADPEGRTRLIFQAAYGFDSFPSSYLIGPDGRIKAAWSGYRPRDEADMARAVVAALKEIGAPAADAVEAPPRPVAPAAR